MHVSAMVGFGADVVFVCACVHACVRACECVYVCVSVSVSAPEAINN